MTSWKPFGSASMPGHSSHFQSHPVGLSENGFPKNCMVYHCLSSIPYFQTHPHMYHMCCIWKKPNVEWAIIAKKGHSCRRHGKCFKGTSTDKNGNGRTTVALFSTYMGIYGLYVCFFCIVVCVSKLEYQIVVFWVWKMISLKTRTKRLRGIPVLDKPWQAHW